MANSGCETCDNLGSVRDPEHTDVDPTHDSAQGLAPLAQRLYGCPKCGVVYERHSNNPSPQESEYTFYVRVDRPPLAGRDLEAVRSERRSIERRLDQARTPDD